LSLREPVEIESRLHEAVEICPAGHRIGVSGETGRVSGSLQAE
jgi:hypothetical protein